MALGRMEKTLCNKLVSDYYNLVAPVKAAKSVIKNAMADLDSYLRSMTFSPAEDVNSAINSFEDSINSQIPGTADQDMNKLKDFLANCPYLAAFAPSSTVGGTKNGIFDAINDKINELLSGVPEFGAGKIASQINSLLNGLSLPGGDALSALLQKADQLLDCLSSLCAAQDPTYAAPLSEATNDLNNLYTDLNIIDNPLSPDYGKFNYTSFYNNIGLTSSQSSALNLVTTNIDNQKSSSVDAVKNSVDKIKSLTKEGGFF